MPKPTPTDPRPALYAAAGGAQDLQQNVLPAENKAILKAARRGHNRAIKELARLGPAIQHLQAHTGGVPDAAQDRYLDLLLERDKYAGIMSRAAERAAQDNRSELWLVRIPFPPLFPPLSRKANPCPPST